MSKRYKNPPIVEALCEFQFIPSQPWDMTIPGILYEKIKEEFPEKQQPIGFGIGFQLGFGIGPQPKEGRIEQKIEMTQRMQFLRSNKTALVQVGPDLLVTNHLKPYPTWNVFKPLILRNLEIYREIAKPRGFKRIGLRYINKIDFTAKSIELSEYFNYYPFIPIDLPQMHEAFNVRVEIPYEEGRDRLILTLASVIPEKPDILSIMLDLNYIMVIPEGFSFDQTADWIEKAHTTVENAFEFCITEKSRGLFEEEK